jgi:FlaA1/EpsC-like NDP-sugar epimerase
VPRITASAKSRSVQKQSGQKQEGDASAMPKQMENKVCLITGGAGSIGVAAARLLATEGAKVMLFDLAEAALRKAAADIGKAAGGENVACARRTSPSRSRSRSASRRP